MSSAMRPTALPVPSTSSVINLPYDHYLHPGAPTEWWWHTGTLLGTSSAGPRTFGFEINAACINGLHFTQIMLTDIQAGTHYSQSSVRVPLSAWAQSDPTQSWFVSLGSESAVLDALGWVSMSSANLTDPTQNMIISAGFIDVAKVTSVRFALDLSQQWQSEGPPVPFNVWGTGVCGGVHTGSMPYPAVPERKAQGGLSLSENNFYYSLTRLQATGTITVGDVVYTVTGLTWMDHEWGGFTNPQGAMPTWVLQDMQLDNGVSISHFITLPAGTVPRAGVPITPTNATIQLADGSIYWDPNCTLTPGTATWTSPQGNTFQLDWTIAIPSFPGTTIHITTPVAGQDFVFLGSDNYEGVSAVPSGSTSTPTSTFLGAPVTGTAWSEQQPATRS